MDEDATTIQTLYERFNARDINSVLMLLTDDVIWANGMDGGYEHGHDAIRSYWTRQWSIVNPHVEPVHIDRQAVGSIIVTVVQTIRDLAGEPLENPAHGLHDKTVTHIFTMHDGKVARFDIGS